MPWRRLALPLCRVAAGFGLVSALELAGVHADLAGVARREGGGMLAVCAAVVLWTWYALANARFLAGHDTVCRGRSTAFGVATGAVALAGLPAAAPPASSALRRARTPVRPGWSPVSSSSASWSPGRERGCGTWPRAVLSPAVAGLLVNLETVSGFGYVYAVCSTGRRGELAGLALVLAGVSLTLTVSAR